MTFLKISTDVDTQVTKTQTSKNPGLELKNWNLSIKEFKTEKSASFPSIETTCQFENVLNTLNLL